MLLLGGEVAITAHTERRRETLVLQKWRGTSGRDSSLYVAARLRKSQAYAVLLAASSSATRRAVCIRPKCNCFITQLSPAAAAKDVTARLCASPFLLGRQNT